MAVVAWMLRAESSGDGGLPQRGFVNGVQASRTFGGCQAVVFYASIPGSGGRVLGSLASLLGGFF